jgi:hypothetical protein
MRKRETNSSAGVRCALALSALASALLLVSCDDWVIPASERTDCGGGMVDLTGAWSIVGTGERWGCADEEFNGPVRLASPAPWLVDKDPEGISLLIRPPSTRTFVDFVETNSMCVSWRTVESVVQNGREDSLRLQWSGRMSRETSTIFGNFEGSYAGNGCRMEGTFEIEVSR